MLNLSHQPPAFTELDAQRFTFEHYGIQAGARALPGEHDQNFYLETSLGETFVLKIAHAGEAFEVLDLQNKTLEHLAVHAPSLVVPRVQHTVEGDTIVDIKDADDALYRMRLLSYIPGKVLADTAPHTSELLRQLGQTLGDLDLALQGFTHPTARRVLKWDLQQASWIGDYLHCIARPERRALVADYLAQFTTQVEPVLSTLRTSVIHNDINDYNIVVQRRGAELSLGLLDFGDMLWTQTIHELAIAAAYVMLGKPDPLAAAARLIAGYHTAFPLSVPELEVLYPLICTRLCVSVTNSAYQRQVAPDNAYLLISEQPAWALLEQLATVSPQFALATFRHACGLVPSPTSAAIVDWLEQHVEQIKPVIEPDMQTIRPVIFDLSVGSLEMGNPQDWVDPENFSQMLLTRLHAAHTPVGIGRYNEARAIYTGEQYRSESLNGPQWRTVHLGLDLFLEAGSTIYAPLDGVVHSFRNNDLPLDYGPTIILQHTVERDGRPLTFFTLYGHLSLDSLDDLYEGKPVAAGSLLARIGDSSINGGWPPHLHLQLMTDLLGRTGEFPGVARADQRAIWLSLCPDPNLLVGVPADFFPAEPMPVEQLLHLRGQHIGKALSISYQQPLTIVRGWRQYLYDESGRAYLDGVNNVCHVGHCHPHVVKAGQQQMATLNTNTRYLHENLVRYAERLCAQLPESLRVCFFVCSGSEANELALRLARTHTRRQDVIVTDAGYHGNTTELINMSPYKYEGPGGTSVPAYVHKTLLADPYRGPYKRQDLEAGQKYAQPIEEITRHHEIAAFICEALPGCGGQIVFPDAYLKEAYRAVRGAGGVCIADEVQIGFGRVGTHFWGFETQGVVPDIVTMGKPIGNGHPLGAVVTTPEIAASFNNGMEYFNTFGGNPVSCAIGLAVLDVIEQEQLQKHAASVGTHLGNGLHTLMEKYPLIGDVRGLGLFLGVECVLDRETLAPAKEQAAYVVNRLKDHGILLSTDGPFHNVLKIKPPLVFSNEDADFLVATLEKVLTEDLAQPL